MFYRNHYYSHVSVDSAKAADLAVCPTKSSIASPMSVRRMTEQDGFYTLGWRPFYGT